MICPTLEMTAITQPFDYYSDVKSLAAAILFD